MVCLRCGCWEDDPEDEAPLRAAVCSGFSPLLPRRVRVTAYFSDPLVPPAWDAGREDAQVDALHAEATERMAALLRR